MPTEIKLPELGEGIEYGTVVRVLVKPGDTVAENQGLMELETDKALVEVPSDAAGKVAQVLVKEGQKVNVGAALVTLEGSGDAAPSEAQAESQQAETKPAPSVEQASKPTGAPKEQAATAGGQQEQGEVAKSAKESPVAAASSRREPEEIAAASNGGRMPPPQDQGESQPGAQGRAPSGAPASSPNGENIPAGPMTRRIARELNIDLHNLRGSGQGGRITPEDVYAAARGVMGGGAALQFGPGGPGGPPHAPALPDFSKWGEVERVALSQVRRLIAEHMAQSWATVPHVTQFERADITELEALRKRYEPEAEKHGGKLTPTALFIKAVVSALRAYPQFNASLDLASGELVCKRYIHLGIAVDTERGLLVPVLRDCDRKDVWQLSAELNELAERARSGRVDVEELRGGSFTISNQGSLGGAEFTPIINWPEVAILGIGRARKEPWVVGDQIRPRLICPLALSYDHRVIDGADAARFIRRLKESLESPERLLLGL